MASMTPGVRVTGESKKLQDDRVLRAINRDQTNGTNGGRNVTYADTNMDNEGEEEFITFQSRDNG
jgi:hypothetical protein